MIDEREVREMLHRRADSVPAAPVDTTTPVRRARRRLVLNGVVATVAAAVIAVASVAGVDAILSAPVPADPPPVELGIFAPVAGRILYVNDGDDRGYGQGLWAIDPNGPSDTLGGSTVADEVASALVPLDVRGAIPLDWSSDGTELLFKRTSDDLFPEEYLYVLHADGSETRLNGKPMNFAGAAAISPDGSRVVFARQSEDVGLYVVDTAGGRPVRLPLAGAEGIVWAPTFSPDGTQIAYLDIAEDRNHVWVMDADGSNAHEDPDGPGLGRGLGSLQWSPAGDRLAMQIDPIPDGDSAVYGDSVISTFAPDGSDFTPVITGGLSPYWSPDGFQIAYTIECDPDFSCGHLAIADADGSNIRGFGFAASGPWHPAAPAPASETTPVPNATTPIPSEGLARADGEVLSFTGVPRLDLDDVGAPGDLVAVNPETGEERLLVADIDSIYSAGWSADGRWVAFETEGADGDHELWVAGGESRERRLVATGGTDLFPDLEWMWSPTGAQLATIGDSKLRTIDLATDETTDLGKIIADLLGPIWAWSPDGTRLVFASPEGAPEGSLDTLDLRSGERSLLARLPDEDWAVTERVQFSPDGAHIAVLIRKASNEAGRLYVMDADGSNIRVVADDYDPLGVAWSPDGTRLAFGEGSEADGVVRIRVAPMDGAAPAEIGSLDFIGCTYNYECTLTWSPDGSQIAFRKAGSGTVDAFDAAGAGETGPIDELTYVSWDRGTFPYRA